MYVSSLSACTVADIVYRPGESPLPDASPLPAGDAAPIVDAPSAPTSVSCTGLANTCGPDGTESCCTSLEVPGGTYYRGYDLAGLGDQERPATVSSFRLDKYEITVGRFRQFVMAGKGTQASPPASGDGAHAIIAGSGWRPVWTASLPIDQAALIVAIKSGGSQVTWTDGAGGNESRPMNSINWYEAMAFCAWDGGYLPTEAEWNYAGTGGNQQRAYPWSDPPAALLLDSSRASYQDGTCMGDGLPGCTLEDYVRVGSKPAGNGRWGHADLAGNVFEWVFDTTYPLVCVDCGSNVGDSAGNLIRGGAATYSVTAALRPGSRTSTSSGSHAAIFGARCARPSAL
jgi:formylglycine-generating enzyme required for sulfatase activity